MKKYKTNNINIIKKEIDKFFCNCNNTVYLEKDKLKVIVDDKRNNKFIFTQKLNEDIVIKDIIDDIQKQMIERYF